MTISVAWIRKLPDGEELVFASDSRLGGGYKWDSAQKIFPLNGLNAVISFAGDCDLAIPLIHQIKSSCESYRQTMDGSLDIHDVKNHIINIINNMRDRIKPQDPELVEMMDKSTKFIFGGYSYKKKKLCLWTIGFNHKTNKFAKKKAPKMVEITV